jgi:hypothetical protein
MPDTPKAVGTALMCRVTNFDDFGLISNMDRYGVII